MQYIEKEIKKQERFAAYHTIISINSLNLRQCNLSNPGSRDVIDFGEEKQKFLQKRFRIALKIQIEKTSNRRSYAAAPPVTFLKKLVLVGNKLCK